MGELLVLRWRDVDFAGSVLRVRASYFAGALTTPKVRLGPRRPDVASAFAGPLMHNIHWTRNDYQDILFLWSTMSEHPTQP